MKNFECHDKNAEVKGDIIQEFLKGFNGVAQKKAHQLLQTQGIDNPDAGAWYPLNSYLSALKEIHENLSDQVLYIAGKRLAEDTKLSGEMDHLEYFVKHLDEYYHANHRGDVGHFSCKDLGEQNGFRRFEITSTTPYGCFFEKGLIEGFAEHFKKDVARDVILKSAEDQPCRTKGGDSCTYIVEWM